MKSDKLLSEGRIERVEKTEVDLTSVRKDIEFAEKGMGTRNYSRVMAIAYEAVLRAVNKLMNYLGYRSIGKEHHKNSFEFMREIKFDEDLIDYFDSVRKKRNEFVYRDIENISGEEAEEILEKSKDFVRKIETLVRKNRTGGSK
jgi:uncharacterized protein (UPF0332 family)